MQVLQVWHSSCHHEATDMEIKDWGGRFPPGLPTSSPLAKPASCPPSYLQLNVFLTGLLSLMDKSGHHPPSIFEPGHFLGTNSIGLASLLPI
jgi:hypothetical protein